MSGRYLLYTDFGWNGPYVGQLKARLVQADPAAILIDLMHDAPSRDPGRASVLLGAALRHTPGAEDAVVVAVVDPGVGGTRRCVSVQADGFRLVGPDNGVFTGVLRRAREVKAAALAVPGDAAPTFHGRDVFGPAAAEWVRTGHQPGTPVESRSLTLAELPDAQIIAVDTYGNAITGIQGETVGPEATLSVNGTSLPRALTFSDVAAGAPFWYINSSGLVEIAVHGGSAADDLALRPGVRVGWTPGPAGAARR